jgi:hypothetical protein
LTLQHAQKTINLLGKDAKDKEGEETENSRKNLHVGMMFVVVDDDDVCCDDDKRGCDSDLR